MRNYKTSGIILARRNFSEADKILTVLTPNLGKISVLAKGVRRLKSRRAPHLELFNEVELVLHQGRRFDIVTESKVLNNFPALRNDLKLVGFAYYLTEVIAKILPDRQSHPEIYSLCHSGLSRISLAPNSQNLVKEIVIELLWELGYLPRRQYPKIGVTNFVESIIEKKINSKKFLESI